MFFRAGLRPALSFEEAGADSCRRERVSHMSDSRDSSFAEEEYMDIRLWRFTRAVEGTKAFFSCRLGGVSRPPYDSLNLGFHVGDDPGQVHRNRQLLGRALGQKASRVTSPRQRHSADVVLLEKEMDIGSGSRMSAANPFDPCDAMVTRLKSAPLLLQFADCVPVVLCAEAERGPVVAVAHAGRRSLVGGVVTNTVKAMAGTGADPSSVTAALGPAVKPCCYRVDAGTAAEFRCRFGDAAVADGSLDLKYGVVADLTRAGVEAGRIHDLDICTCCDGDFFSYRRDGPATGRQGAMAWIG